MIIWKNQLTKTICVFAFLILSQPLLSQDDRPTFSDETFDTKRNFGMVINNSTYQIYRSAKLGKKGIHHVWEHLDNHNLPRPKTVIYMNDDGYKWSIYSWRKFALEEFEIQDEYGFRFYHPFDYSYRTYLDGENPYDPEDDIDAEKKLGKKAKALFGVVEDNKLDGGIDSLKRILDVVLDPNNQPVLFHCFGGVHRTGMVGMILRYLQGGWWTDGPTIMKKKQIMNMAQYEYYRHNKLFFRQKNVDFVKEFSKDPLFKSYEEEFGEDLREGYDLEVR